MRGIASNNCSLTSGFKNGKKERRRVRGGPERRRRTIRPTTKYCVMRWRNQIRHSCVLPPPSSLICPHYFLLGQVGKREQRRRKADTVFSSFNLTLHSNMNLEMTCFSNLIDRARHWEAPGIPSCYATSSPDA